MSWQSMFDAGPCEVGFSDNLDAQWSGVLAKGESSPIVPTSFSGNFQISVDASGVVTLTTDNPWGAATGNGCSLYVSPQFDVSVLQTRLSAISASSSDAEIDNTKSTAYDDIDDVPVSLVFPNSSGGDATPAAATFAAHASTGFASCAVRIHPLGAA